MAQINDMLKTIGLTETEAEIYLVGLAQSSVGVSEIVKQTRIKRTTVYHALDTLMQKGLTAKHGTGSRLVFAMVPPTHLEKLIDERVTILQKQKEALKAIVPLLEQKTNSSSQGVRVSQFDGIEGIKMVVEEALYCKTRHWDILAPAKNFFSEFDQAYADYFISSRKERNITSRSLWEENPGRRILTPEEIKQREPRYLPKVMFGKFKSVLILFDDKAAMITSLKELSAVLIQSKEVHDTLTAMFEGLWIASEPYEKKS